MITNEVQYRATRTHLSRFEEAISNLEEQTAAVREQKRRSLELRCV